MAREAIDNTAVAKSLHAEYVKLADAHNELQIAIEVMPMRLAAKISTVDALMSVESAMAKLEHAIDRSDPDTASELITELGRG